jgi:streptogramin lyase
MRPHLRLLVISKRSLSSAAEDHDGGASAPGSTGGTMDHPPTSRWPTRKTATAAAAIGAVTIALMLAASPASAQTTDAAPAEVTTTSSLGHPPPQHVEIPLQPGSAPVYAVDAFGALWVNAHRAAVLSRVDPATNAVETIPVPTNQCGLAAADNLLWFPNCAPTGYFPNPGPPTTFGLNPTTRAFVSRLPVWGEFAGGSLWTVENNATFVRRDPQTGAEQARVPLRIIPNPNGTSPGTECYGSLWTVNEINNVQRTDLATNTSKIITLKDGNRPPPNLEETNFACAEGKVWVPNGLGLFRIDPRTNATKRFPVTISNVRPAFFNVPIASDGHDLFVRNFDTSVARIDARTGKVVQHYPADTGGGGIAVAYGSLWVVNAVHDTLWRYPL